MRVWADKTEIAAGRFLIWIGIGTSKFHDWKSRFGKVNEHNTWVPRDHWLTDAEKEGIHSFARQHPLEGYRRLTFMMLDADVVACSPASVYRVLKAAGLLAGQTPTPTKKGTGFVQPLRPHEHWHIDVSYLNIAGTFYFLCSILDGCSRFIVHWEIREKMEEIDVETIVQRGREAYPLARPRIISDNGPQFIAKDFKEFIRICGMTHVKTSPYYPQSNGKIERWHKTLKGDCIRVLTPLSLDDARRIVADYVTHYNTIRLHSASATSRPRTSSPAAKLRSSPRGSQTGRGPPPPPTTTPSHRQPGAGSASLTPCHRLRRPPRLVTMAAVLQLLGFQSRSSHGVQQRGPCPLHGSTSGTSRCFSANLEQHTFHCFKCGRSGNALDLWAHATGQSTYDAAIDLCQRLHLSVPELTAPEPRPKPRNREEEPVAPP